MAHGKTKSTRILRQVFLWAFGFPKQLLAAFASTEGINVSYTSNSNVPVSEEPVVRLAYSPDETAILVGAGRTFIFQELKNGRLKSVRIGGRRFITREAIQAWLVAASEGNES